MKAFGCVRLPPFSVILPKKRLLVLIIVSTFHSAECRQVVDKWTLDPCKRTLSFLNSRPLNSMCHPINLRNITPTNATSPLFSMCYAILLPNRLLPRRRLLPSSLPIHRVEENSSPGPRELIKQK
jgi:hypothetical protein